MFWMWYSEMQYMETEPGHHVSQIEMLSQRLFGRTFWGDYGGDIYSRANYEFALENFPGQVESINAAHGQGLVLVRGSFQRFTREFMEFLAFFGPGGGYEEYPLYDESWYSDWECELQNTEMVTGWWGDYTSREVRNEVENLADGWGDILVPNEEWGPLLFEFMESKDWFNESPYWEGADSLIVPGFEAKDMALWLIQREVTYIEDSGNPEPLVND